MSKPTSSSLKGEGLLAKNTLINLLGKGIPLVFAAFAIPYVIDGLGTDRFGVLTIVWVIIGYFGLFDMGIGRATTKFVADLEAKGTERLGPFIFMSISLLFVIGIAGCFLIYFLTPLLVSRLLNIPPSLVDETAAAFKVLSISIPFVLATVGARGALEARQRFAIVNAIKIPASIINYVTPLLVLPFTNSLKTIVTVLVVARIFTFLGYFYFSVPGRWSGSFENFRVFHWMKELLSFGAWIMVSNFISPLMEYMDRFIIGGILTMSAVAFYTTPFEVVIRFMIIASSFMGVMFPAFSVYALSDSGKLRRLYKQSLRLLLSVMVPLIIFLIIAAHAMLYLWLGQAFAEHSTAVLRILALGVLFNSIAFVPYTILQASGRPDITAKLHMFELPVYLAAIWYLTHAYGINGAAFAWFFRVGLDALLLLYFSNRHLDFFEGIKRGQVIKGLTAAGLVVAGVIIYGVIQSIILTLLYAALCTVVAFGLAWFYLLQRADRAKIKQFIASRAGTKTHTI